MRTMESMAQTMNLICSTLEVCLLSTMILQVVPVHPAAVVDLVVEVVVVLLHHPRLALTVAACTMRQTARCLPLPRGMPLLCTLRMRTQR